VSLGELDRHQWRLLPRREEEEREGEEKERVPGGLSSAHKVHSKVGPTIRGTTYMSQVHISFSL
jgi:hypothetical protein